MDQGQELAPHRPLRMTTTEEEHEQSEKDCSRTYPEALPHTFSKTDLFPKNFSVLAIYFQLPAICVGQDREKAAQKAKEQLPRWDMETCVVLFVCCFFFGMWQKAVKKDDGRATSEMKLRFVPKALQYSLPLEDVVHFLQVRMEWLGCSCFPKRPLLEIKVEDGYIYIHIDGWARWWHVGCWLQVAQVV